MGDGCWQGLDVLNTSVIIFHNKSVQIAGKKSRMEAIKAQVNRCNAEVLSFVDKLDAQVKCAEQENSGLETANAELLAQVAETVDGELVPTCHRLTEAMNGVVRALPELRQRAEGIRQMRLSMESLLDSLNATN